MAVTESYTFEEVLAEFQANPSATVNQALSNVVGLAGGGFAFVCASDGPNPTDDMVQIAIYAAPNDPQPSFIRRCGADVQGEPVVTQLTGGRVAFVWQEGPVGKNGLVVSIFDPAAGTIVVDEKKVPNSSPSRIDPEVTALANGNLACVFRDADNGKLYYQAVSPSGTAVGGLLPVADNATDPAIVQLAGGRIAITFTTSRDVKAKLFEADGTPVAGLGEITVGPGATQSTQIAALRNGGFAVVFEDDAISGDDEAIGMKIYDADGADQTAGGAIRVDIQNADSDNDPEITVLNNGFILVTYTALDSTDTIQGRLFTQEGASVAVDGAFNFTIHRDDASTESRDRGQSSVAALLGGQFVSTWTDAATDGDGNSISGRVRELVRVQTGNGADDVFFSSDGLRDIMHGGGGKDVLFGSTGRDDLFGDAGNDSVVVRTGEIEADETYDGGSDSDELRLLAPQADFRASTVAGFEKLVLLSNTTARFTADQFSQFGAVLLPEPEDEVPVTRVVEITMGDRSSLSLAGVVVTGAAQGASFRITGDFDTETITGSSITDRIEAGGGNDTLNGGLGADKLNGGSGSDTASYATAKAGVVASLANASINKGEAAGDTYVSIERLTGSAFADTLNGANTVNNTINGGAGNDTLKGYSGNDRLSGGAGNDTFAFNTALNATTNLDTVTDFKNESGNNDRFLLDDAFFAGIVGDAAKGGELFSGFFKDTKKGAIDANDHLIYVQSSGNLYYDGNGSDAGERVLFAKVTPGTALTYHDFFVN